MLDGADLCLKKCSEIILSLYEISSCKEVAIKKAIALSYQEKVAILCMPNMLLFLRFLLYVSRRITYTVRIKCLYAGLKIRFGLDFLLQPVGATRWMLLSFDNLRKKTIFMGCLFNFGLQIHRPY